MCGIRIFLWVVVFLYSNSLFAIERPLCEISEYSNGYRGKLSFRCNEDVSLSDNKAVFYIVGDANLDKIALYNVKVKFKSREIAKNLTKVSVNLVTEGIFGDRSYVVKKDKAINLRLLFSGKAKPKYKVLWGGVIKNSYKQKVIKSSDIQIFQNMQGRVYFYKKGLKCAIENDCDDKFYIDKNCKEHNNCNKFDKDGNNKNLFGLVY